MGARPALFAPAALLLLLLSAAAGTCPEECECVRGILRCERPPSERALAPFAPTLEDLTLIDFASSPDESWFRNLSLPLLKRLTVERIGLERAPLLPPLPSLNRLSLAFNALPVIRPEAFANLPQLTELNFEHNQIVSLNGGDLPPLRSLRILRLGSNRIENVDTDFFDGMPELDELRLNKNRLCCLGKNIFRHLGSLRVLELNKNRIKEIDALVFQNLTRLARLRLRHNRIEVLDDGAFYGLKLASVIQLDGNLLTTVAKHWMWGLESLHTLSLSSNKIKTIEVGCWEWSGRLRELDLSDNLLRTINATTFEQLSNLEVLRLNGNLISSITENSFVHMSNLRLLDLSRNEISWIIEDMHMPFNGLGRLVNISLANNHIKSVGDKAFAGLKRLTQLDLSGNNLTSLQERSFDPLSELRELHINTSSLICDCNLSWLKSRISRLVDLTTVHLVCAYPAGFRGRGLLELPRENFTCDNSPKPKIIENPKSKMAVKGSSAVLRCIATSGTQVNFFWKRNNTNITDLALKESAMVENGVNHYISELIIPNVTDSDSGRYQCIVSNRYGMAYSERSHMTTVILPRFIKIPLNVTVNAGDTAKLECTAQGQPKPEISWLKDEGTDFPAAHERRMHMIPGDDMIFIINSKTSDNGVYSCTAKNNAGSIVSYASLTVLEAPTFVKRMENKEVVAGESVVIECIVSGSPKPDLNWLKDGVPIMLTDRHFFTAEEQILVIVGAVPSDEGLYECEIKNSLGTVTDSTELKVLPMPTSPIGVEDDMMGIIIITVVCCAVGTSIIWVVIIYQTRKRLRNSLPRRDPDSFQLAPLSIEGDTGLQMYADNVSERSSCKDSGTGDSAKRSSLEILPMDDSPLTSNSKVVSVYVNLNHVIPGENRPLDRVERLNYDCDPDMSIQMHALDDIVPEITPHRTYPYS